VAVVGTTGVMEGTKVAMVEGTIEAMEGTTVVMAGTMVEAITIEVHGSSSADTMGSLTTIRMGTILTPIIILTPTHIPIEVVPQNWAM
jgi:hypothetical protein